ncbi:MAG: c-type cytochrome [gamma proteobacterium endosymbiont of Lamellibrachia anaximandri]|nr:c-type cytochrome [gamma proteobacterium endosymbiont of Lamellibrachia anaximandri]MBL3532293.1 c-type cytochrome [gamma proteobacterium endosymbiont of Lamellibrachia anaximandri]MBL3601426.1 c-type cytochrome [gamma proteobacterium endosymbiont of Lamellibrachia anaximandri]
MSKSHTDPANIKRLKCPWRLFILLGGSLLPGSTIFAIEPIQPIPQHVEYDKQKAALGKKLFFDPILSQDQTVSCATCHDPEAGGADYRTVSEGIFNRPGKMNSPTVFNSYFNFRQFWNGRADNLASQVSGPLHNPVEMGLTLEEVDRRLNLHPEYPRQFKSIYGKSRVEIDDMADAIAEFEKALYTPNAKFDRYLRGELELDKAALDGYRLFKKIGCAACHNGINIGGNSYQYLGAVIPVEWRKDQGDLHQRTGDPFDKNRYKVPSLRNIALTSPYLHDGSAATLNKVLKKMAFHNLGFELSEDQITLLMAFLNTLTGDMPAILDTP